MRVDLSSCALGSSLEDGWAADRDVPSGPYSGSLLSGSSARRTPTRGSSRCDAGRQRRGEAVPQAALVPSPCPFSASLASCPVSAFSFLSYAKTGGGLPGAFPSERGCEFRVWGGILSEPRRPGPPRARSEGQAGGLGGEETPSPGGPRSGVRRAYLPQPSPRRTLSACPCRCPRGP